MDKLTGISQKLQENDALFIAVFGTFWGIIESTFGTALHMFRFPFTGLVLGQAGMMILLNASTIHYKRGNILIMGMIAALIKAVAISTIKVGPIMGIISEALVIELVLILAGRSKFSFVLSGTLISLLPICINLTTKTISFGFTFLEFLVDFLDSLSEIFSFAAGWYLVGIYFTIHLSIGAMAGWLAWRISTDITRKLSTSDI